LGRFPLDPLFQDLQPKCRHLHHLRLQQVTHCLRIPCPTLPGQQPAGGEALANLPQGQTSGIELQGLLNNRLLGGVGVEVDAISFACCASRLSPCSTCLSVLTRTYATARVPAPICAPSIAVCHSLHPPALSILPQHDKHKTNRRGMGGRVTAGYRGNRRSACLRRTPWRVRSTRGERRRLVELLAVCSHCSTQVTLLHLRYGLFGLLGPCHRPRPRGAPHGSATPPCRRP
jgi:hypothetical protein